MLPLCWSFLICLFIHASAAPTDIPSAASFYIPSIPHIHQDERHPLLMYGGHLRADSNTTAVLSGAVTAHLYFFMVKNRKTADKDRVIFWFNGGPGCSSFDGAMMEVGPWRWDGKSEQDFWVKPGGWDEYTTVVYVDQPAGTGFSYTSTDRYVHTMDTAQRQLMEFLKNFYDVFPEYKTMDTYFAGESFAGQWIPYYADAILNSTMRIPLRGIAIGNGWMDANNHYLSYLDYSVKVGLIEENTDGWKQVKQAMNTCTASIEKTHTNHMLNNDCTGVLFSVLKVKERKVNNVDMCVNIYDIRLEDTSPACGMNWPPEVPAIRKFLGRPEVVNALHATAHPGSWVECRSSVHQAFHEKDIESSTSVLPRVLSKIPTLLFVGDQDLICNYIGIENMINALTWNGETGLGTVQTQSWNVNSLPAGTWVTSRNLTYAKIFNASHMAPFDVPHVTHDMMLRFMGVNFSAILDGSAKIPSSIGTDAKPIFGETDAQSTSVVMPAKTPQQDKAMWEAYYNAGSATLVLILIFIAIGIFIWYRIRRNRVQLPTHHEEQVEEETIPLTRRRENEDEDEGEEVMQRRKGKERLREPEPERELAESPIFHVGDSDDEEEYKRIVSGE